VITNARNAHFHLVGLARPYYDVAQPVNAIAVATLSQATCCRRPLLPSPACRSGTPGLYRPRRQCPAADQGTNSTQGRRDREHQYQRHSRVVRDGSFMAKCLPQKRVTARNQENMPRLVVKSRHGGTVYDGPPPASSPSSWDRARHPMTLAMSFQPMSTLNSQPHKDLSDQDSPQSPWPILRRLLSEQNNFKFSARFPVGKALLEIEGAGPANRWLRLARCIRRRAAAEAVGERTFFFSSEGRTMALRWWQWTRASFQPGRASRRGQRASTIAYRPRVEALEDRTLPSAVLVHDINVNTVGSMAHQYYPFNQFVNVGNTLSMWPTTAFTGLSCGRATALLPAP